MTRSVSISTRNSLKKDKATLFQKDVKTQNIFNDIFYLKILQQGNCPINLPHNNIILKHRE